MSAAERVFALRMAPHMERGLSVACAAKAVLDDDARLAAAFFSQGTSYYFPTPDECGIARTTDERAGDIIIREISRAVWSALRAHPTPGDSPCK